MRIHIKELPKQIAIAYAARTNMLIVSKPAVGKTWTVQDAANIIRQRVEGAGYWPLDLTTMSPNDICVYMPDMKEGKLAVFPNAELPNAYDNPDQTGIVFEDEALNADPTVTKVTQKYNNGESIGGRLRKPDGVIVVAAGNRLSDRAGVMQQSRAWLSRVEQWEVYSTPEWNLEFADRNAWYPVIVEFFKKFPALIDNYEDVYEFDPRNDKAKSGDRAQFTEEGKRGVWANMRAWKRLSDLEFACRNMGAKLHPMRAQANLGQAVGAQYMTYRALHDNMVSLEEVLKDPKGVAVPDRLDQQYILLNMLAAFVKTTEIKALDKFLERIGGDLRVMTIRRMMNRWRRERTSFDLPKTPEFKAWVKDPAFSDLIVMSA